MNVARIEEVLRQIDPGMVQAGRVKWLAEFEAVYEANGVLVDGVAPALQCCCPSAGECWQSAEDRMHPVVPATVGVGERGSIFWPWVGKEYRLGGVCFVSLNINAADSEDDWWSIGEEYGIAQHVLQRFEEGDRTPFAGSPFFWRLCCTANAVIASLDGGEVLETPESVERAGEVLERISRVQAVKCAPLFDARAPTPAMRRRCPGRFAIPELNVLRPGVLVALGQDAFDAVQSLSEGGAVWTEESAHYYRGALTLPGGQVEVIWLYHPTARPRELWAEGQAELVASLRARPLARA